MRSQSLKRRSNFKLWLGKFIVFWMRGRLWEVVAYERWSRVEVRLYLHHKRKNIWQISNFCAAVVIYPSPWTQTPEKREERGVAGAFWCYVRSYDVRLTLMPNWLVGMTLFHVSRAGDNFCTNLQRTLSQFVNVVAERAPNTRPAVIGWSMLVILRSSLCTPTLPVILDSKVIHPLKTKRKPYE